MFHRAQFDLSEEECLYEREDHEEDAGHFSCWIENSANSQVIFGWLCRVLVWSDLSDVSRQWKVFQNLPPEGRTGKLGKADSGCVSLPKWDGMFLFFFLMRKVGRASTKSVWVDVNFIVKSTKQQALVAQDCVCKAPGHWWEAWVHEDADDRCRHDEKRISGLPKKDLLDPFRINISQHFFLYEISLAMRCFPYTVTPIPPTVVSFNSRNLWCTPNSPYLPAVFWRNDQFQRFATGCTFGTPFSLALKCKMIMFGWPTNLWKVHKSCGKLMKFIFWPNLRHGRIGIHKKKG